MRRIWITFVLCCLLLCACHDRNLNNPHPASEEGKNIFYTTFVERPKTLDPARSYSSDESVFTTQIYEPPLQYDYLKRPYELIPLTAAVMPVARYFDLQDKPLPNDAPTDQIAYTVYDIKIQPGIYFQQHPAFAKDKQGKYYYHHLSAKQLAPYYEISDFEHTGTRELTAADYVYQIKRLASPQTRSPIFGLMSHYIIGMPEFAKKLQQVMKNKKHFIDLQKYELAGAKVLDKYTYRITVKGKYPQFIYWLAMPFFAAVPWEAEYFYSQPGMGEKDLSLNWYPVGTGPYTLAENNPNSEMVLEKNSNYRNVYFPIDGSTEDKAQGYLNSIGKTLPIIDKIVFDLEKESIPRWNKFLQGYYDNSAIASDSFDQAIRIDRFGEPHLTPEMRQHHIQLQTSIALASMYLGFNMRDDIVGGTSERARLLRQAISIALDYEDFIAIFLNGRGITAQSPLPPGIFGHIEGKEGIDPYVYQWKNNQAQRLPLSYAKKLLAKAGYPNGRNVKTGKRLTLYYDTVASSGPDDKARLDWMRKQFKKLGIELNIRATTYNRFQQKVRDGNTQLFSWGWIADYPDPENFLFLLYGPNGKLKHGGENAVNYANKEFDRLYLQMQDLPNGEERLNVIKQMLAIVQRDAPWVFGYHPLNFVLRHAWVAPYKLSSIGDSSLKYMKINPALREKKRLAWNKPVWWPVILIMGLLLLIIVPLIIQYWIREYRAKVKKSHLSLRAKRGNPGARATE